MSNEGRLFVERHSPYTGATYWIHHKFGDIENETYGHRLFISEENIAAVCRTNVRTVRRAKKQMIEDGFLRLVKPAVGRRVAEYEFLFPTTAVEIVLEKVADGDEIAGHLIPNSRTSATDSRTSEPDSRTSEPVFENTPYIRTKENKTGTEVFASPEKSGDGHTPENQGVVKSAQGEKPFVAEFDAIWKIYPRKIGKAKAYANFVARLRAGETLENLEQATQNYARIRQGEPDTYTLHASTFFGSSLRYQDFLDTVAGVVAVSYTHLTLPTKRIV